MGNYEHDSHSESNWEDGWETNWNEFNWEHYLRREESEVSKYRKLYAKLIRSSNRLDEVALFMGWQHGAEDSVDTAETEPGEMPPPYTLHKHPLFVSSKALHGWLLDKWAQNVELRSDRITSKQALSLHSAFNESDYYGLLAVTALDVNDFALAIAYFKRGMVAINQAFELLSELDSVDIDPLPMFLKHARTRLFDIREIWLRVSTDCRETISRRADDE